MNAAIARRPRDQNARLLVIDEFGRMFDHTHRDLPSLLRTGDLVVANDAATLPAGLTGVHLPSGEAIEVRLAGHPPPRRGLVHPQRRPGTCHGAQGYRRFIALVLGAGDYRTRTEERLPPPALHVGDALRVASLDARVMDIKGHPRLIELEFEHPAGTMWEALARNGRPIQYAHVPQPLALWDTWTSIAAQPVAFEAPSAGFILDWSMLGELRRHGVRFATVTHAAGISSTGDPELDARLPFDEPYFISAPTADLIARTQAEGGRIIALGTTVVRALEHAARETGHITPGNGLATGRIGAETPLRVADAIVSGVHEPGTSHYDLLRAFHSDAVIARMWEEAEKHQFMAHEFGDAVLIMRSIVDLGSLILDSLETVEC